MTEKNQKFPEVIGYFSQKLEQIGQGVLPSSDSYDGQKTFIYSVPDSKTGKGMTLFLDLQENCLDVFNNLKLPDSKRFLTLAEIVNEGRTGRGHILVQSDECEEIVTFQFEGDRIVPDSKHSFSREYTEKLEKLVYAKEGIDLAFEAYRSQSERD